MYLWWCVVVVWRVACGMWHVGVWRVTYGVFLMCGAGCSWCVVWDVLVEGAKTAGTGGFKIASLWSAHSILVGCKDSHSREHM